ncbi:probable pre-mRNA-splicing factor ATP-dependent RNA helicase DEAH5 [Tanacetum coccineum]
MCITRSLDLNHLSSLQYPKKGAGRGLTDGPVMLRLYTKFAYNYEMSPASIPEILRINLGVTALTLKAMGIGDLFAPQALISAMQQLYSLGALDEEALFIEKKSKIFQPEGDQLILLTVYKAWKDNNFYVQWCYENFVQVRSLKRSRCPKVTFIFNGQVQTRRGECWKELYKDKEGDNCWLLDPQEGYRTIVDNQPVYMHPASALFQRRQPDWVIYHELVMTTKEYIGKVTVIDPKWLVELAPTFFKLYQTQPTKRSKSCNFTNSTYLSSSHPYHPFQTNINRLPSITSCQLRPTHS